MPEQRIVTTRQLTEVADCLEAMATGKGGWAWEDVLDELRAIIDGPGVEPVAWIHPMDVGRFPSVQFERLNDEMLPLYLASPSAPEVPDGSTQP